MAVLVVAIVIAMIIIAVISVIGTMDIILAISCVLRRTTLAGIVNIISVRLMEIIKGRIPAPVSVVVGIINIISVRLMQSIEGSI